ncbi:hypothetical protein GE21DRAFT_1223795 [Neurospora crassa]|nr:hypothetical protein GE21DRAFT_1223795 [Neurospora crassa]
MASPSWAKTRAGPVPKPESESENGDTKRVVSRSRIMSGLTMVRITRFWRSCGMVRGLIWLLFARLSNDRNG